jgi:hypothetical protein
MLLENKHRNVYSNDHGIKYHHGDSHIVTLQAGGYALQCKPGRQEEAVMEIFYVKEVSPLHTNI